MLSDEPRFEPGRVYRTSDLAQWSANPTRMAARLVESGELVRLRHGLFAAPRRSRWGIVPPDDDALLSAFLHGSPYLISGPPRWNPLGLGATAMFASTLVYNTRRTGEFELGGRRFLLRRVRFPEHPTAEWFAVDLLSNAGSAGASIDELTTGLRGALRSGRLDSNRLSDAARLYATQDVQERVAAAVAA